jgi:hypothetical protein
MNSLSSWLTFLFRDTKVCKSCNQQKLLNKFRKQIKKRNVTKSFNNGHHSIDITKVVKENNEYFTISTNYHLTCKDCINKKKRVYNQLPEIKKRNKQYYKNEEVIERYRVWRNTPEQKKKKSKRGKIYRQLKEVKEHRRKYLREYDKKRKATDKVYDMKKRVRRTICTTLARGGYTKKSRSFEILGIGYDGFVKHIESLFRDGMSWDNRTKWHLDHIVPISFAQCEEDIIKLNHYTNLRPLWAEENIKRSNNTNYKIKWKFEN